MIVTDLQIEICTYLQAWIYHNIVVLLCTKFGEDCIFLKKDIATNRSIKWVKKAIMLFHLKFANLAQLN